MSLLRKNLEGVHTLETVKEKLVSPLLERTFTGGLQAAVNSTGALLTSTSAGSTDGEKLTLSGDLSTPGEIERIWILRVP